MAAQPVAGQYLIARHDQPLIGIPVEENGEQYTYYFVDVATMHAVLPRRKQDAFAAIGAWADLDWEEAIEALDRIRHESKPTPPIGDIDDL